MARGFFGRYEHSLDAKGRVILPSKFRASFETLCFVTQHQESCLALWTPPAFDEQLEAMEVRARSGAQADRNFARVWAAGAFEAEIDRTGRVALPQTLREYAKLDGQILVVGAIDRIELWSPPEWEARVAPATSAFRDPPADPV